MESNSITQLGYKAGMVYLASQMQGGSLHQTCTPASKKRYKFVSHVHAYSAEFLESAYILIILPESHLHTAPPLAHALSVVGVALWWSWGWSQKSSSQRIDVFLGLTFLRCIQIGQRHSFCIVPFFVVCTADYEMLRCRSPSLVSKASLFNPYMLKP